MKTVKSPKCLKQSTQPSAVRPELYVGLCIRSVHHAIPPLRNR
jgi:hypothetical protein